MSIAENDLDKIIINNPSSTIIARSNKYYTIPSSSRVHTLIVGETGSGKSETMKLLIYQNILRREGFMLIDPHGSLARSIIKILNEKGGLDRVIYINPEASDNIIRINPLEIKDYNKTHLALMSFISALKNLYDYAWGDRLETILRNAINLVMEADPPCTLSKIARVLADIKYREMLIRGSADRLIELFWHSVYPNYVREAFTAVYNKLDKLLSIASIRRMFDVEESNIDIEQAIEEQKIVIIDLGSNFSDDIIRFLGSLFIHLLYLSARRRIDRYEDLSNIKPYYLYVDEAHMINTFAIREVLNTLRKFNVKVTLATQTITAFDKQIQKELPALCRTIIAFRSDMETSEAFSYLFGIKPEQLYDLPLHYFYFYNQGEIAIRGLAKSYVI